MTRRRKKRELIRPHEAAELLDVSTRQVHRMIGPAPDQLHAVRLAPRTIRIYRSSVERMLKARAMHEGR